MDLNQVELIYRAEGNANLVLALPQYKKVLRLPKTSLDNSKRETIVNPQLHIGYIVFVKKIFNNDSCYVPEIVTISASEREKINEFIAPYRPVERLDKGFCEQFGLLFPDATYLLDSYILPKEENITEDTFCVEIKPKQGWIINDFTSLLDTRNLSMCRYCSMQYLKLKKGKITKLSKYCPMDLFSGDKNKMRKSINALLESPQNNLRIFKNGILVYGSKQQLMTVDEIVRDITNGNFSDFENIILTCLLRDDFKSAKSTSVNCTIENGYYHNSCNTETNLPPNCILNKILEVQNLAKDNINLVMKEESNDEKTYTYLDNLVKKRFQPIDFSKLSPKEKYILGATCMDCSVMISFKKIHPYDNAHLPDTKNVIKIENQYFIAKVTVVDLDPKPDHHIHKYLRQTKEAYVAANEYLQT